MSAAATELPPGLTAETSNNAPEEESMSALLAAGDHVGAIATLRASKAPNQRMINMAFSAAVDGCGVNVSTAADDMLKACAAAGL